MCTGLSITLAGVLRTTEQRLASCRRCCRCPGRISGRLPTEEKEGDVVMEDTEEEEAITWEEYDFTKPTGCDHSTCNGCITEGIWGGAWVAV